MKRPSPLTLVLVLGALVVISVRFALVIADDDRRATANPSPTTAAATTPPATSSTSPGSSPTTPGTAPTTPVDTTPATSPVTDALPAVVAAAQSIEQTPTTIVARPKTSNGRAVIYVHGAGGDQWAPFRGAALAGITAGLLDAGFTVAATDGAGTQTWGNDDSLNTDIALSDRLIAQGLTVSVLAESMGGLTGTRLIDRVPVARWVGIYPVCNLQSMATGSYADRIQASHPTDLPAALSNLSPIVAQRDIPMLYLASDADTVVPRQTNAAACAAAQRAAGSTVEEIKTTGDHGDPSNLVPAPIVAFFSK